MFFADIHVGDIDREDLESRSGVEAFLQHQSRNRIGIFEHFLVRAGRADRGDDALPDPGEDGLLPCAADQLPDIRAHGHPGFGDELNAVFGDGGHRRRLDHLGLNRHLHGLENITTGQVDGRCRLEVQFDIRLVGRNQGIGYPNDVAAGQVVGLQFFCDEGKTGLGGRDHRRGDHRRVDLPYAHQDEFDQADLHSGEHRLDPDRDDSHQHENDHQCRDQRDDTDDEKNLL